MYTALFGENADAEKLLKMLDLTREDFGRFRDCYLSPDGERIIVYTRCGGGNREAYDEVYLKMEQHTFYITNYDDDFDETYSSFEFSVPPKYAKVCHDMLGTTDTKTGTERLIESTKALEENPDEYIKNNKGLQNMIASLDKVFQSDKGGVYIINKDGTVEEAHNGQN